MRGGGFANTPGGAFRVDATCWATLALQTSDATDPVLDKARRALVRVQQEDGRICITTRHPEALWPTPLAILSWYASATYSDPMLKAAKFLLGFDRLFLVDDPETRAIIDYDPTIRGWPWIAGTFPWLEPTAYCIMALRLAGFAEHARTREARRLIMDRQLPAGGWNYGSTTIYGAELRPAPETTGIALQAIAGLVARKEVARSLDYLHSHLAQVTTPFALAWVALGLSAWKEAADCSQRVQRVFDKWEDKATWDTVSLSLLVLAWRCRNGLLDWLWRSQGEA